jgi:hypothetical protein
MMSLTLDVPASLHEIDLRLHHARAAWHELLDKGHLRMAEIARRQIDTLLDIRFEVQQR